MKIGYLKLGRSWNVDPAKWSSVGGDVDVWNTLDQLARRNPQHEFITLGRNSGDDPVAVGLPPNVTNPWANGLIEEMRAATAKRKSPMSDDDRVRVITAYDNLVVPLFADLDHVVCWAGQHSPSNHPIPEIGQHWGGKHTTPHDSYVLYGCYVTRGLSGWRDVDPVAREEVWLCPDPRNYLHARDLKWPLRHPIVSQFNQTRESKHERYAYDEPPHPAFKIKKIETRHVWVTNHSYGYDALEVTALPNPEGIVIDYDTPRYPFGMIINENKPGVKNNRLDVLKEWVLPNFPDCEIWGQWRPESQKKLGRDVRIVPFEHMLSATARYRCTLTTPASGSGWATAKPWEAFLVGTVCFFHPGYDTQGHIIPLRPGTTTDPDIETLANWLRPSSPESLRKRVEAVQSDDGLWRQLAEAQRRYVDRVYAEKRAIHVIEDRLGLVGA